jgi:hypothetical protein
VEIGAAPPILSLLCDNAIQASPAPTPHLHSNKTSRIHCAVLQEIARSKHKACHKLPVNPSFPILLRGRIANLDASYFFPIIHRVRTWTHSSPGATLLRDFRRPSSKSEALTQSPLVSSETLLQNPSLIRLWIAAMLHRIYHLSLEKDIVMIYAGNCRRGLILNYCCSGRSRMQELLVLFK